MNNNQNFYIQKIQSVPLLSKEEELDLATKSFSGDKIAQKKLVEANLRFVVKIAHQYEYYMDLDDLIAEGNLGLWHAAEKYNPGKNTKFITYAVFWIRAYIQKAIRETSTGVRFPATKLSELKEFKNKILDLDKPIGEDEDGAVTIASFVKDERVTDFDNDMIQSEINSTLYSLIDNLSPKEKTVIVKRFGFDGTDPMSLNEIGEILKLSKEGVRQLEKRALTKLRKIVSSSDSYSLLAA